MMFNIKMTQRQWELRLRIQIPPLEILLILIQTFLLPHSLFPLSQFLSDAAPVNVNLTIGVDLTKSVKPEKYRWKQI